MFLKGLIPAALESSEPLHFLRLNGRVGAIPTYRVYQLRAGGDGGAGRAFALPLFGGPYRK